MRLGAPPRNFFKMVRFGVYLDPILFLKFFEKYHFIQKIIILDTRLLLGITHGEIFENITFDAFWCIF